MKTESSLSKKQKDHARRVIADPVLFASHVLGVEVWGKEAEILQSIKNNRRTAVKACHGVGKTFSLAIAVLWWLARYPEGIVLTTSATQRQVRTQLWSEIHRLVGLARVPYPALKTTELVFRDNNNFAIGFSTNQSENFQGYHGKQVLIIADEAPGIESGIWDAIAGTMAAGKVHIIMAGNPTMPSGAFFDAFTRERALWHCIGIDAFDSPNLKGLTLEKLLQLDPREGGPLDQNSVPYLTTKRWVYDQYLVWWHGDERSSPNWMSRVRAQFPEQAQNALIKLAWLERAKPSAMRDQVVDTGSSRLVAGVDVGGGEAETVVYVCEYRRDRLTIIGLSVWRGEDTRGHVAKFLEQYRRRLSSVRVDAIGIGHNFGLHLRDLGYPVELVNVSRACEDRPELAENNPALRFVNLKAQYYQTLADAFELNHVYGFTDDVTLGQLANLLYEIDSQGRIRIEPKEKARLRGRTSPDRAEALMLAIGKPFQRRTPDYMLRDLADIRNREGQSVDQIAEYLDATPDEVKSWLHEASVKRQKLEDPFPHHCAVDGQYIPPGTEYVRQGDRYYHVECLRRFMSGG
jgi:phage terminase large subunit